MTIDECELMWQADWGNFEWWVPSKILDLFQMLVGETKKLILNIILRSTRCFCVVMLCQGAKILPNWSTKIQKIAILRYSEIDVNTLSFLLTHQEKQMRKMSLPSWKKKWSHEVTMAINYKNDQFLCKSNKI